MIATLIVVGFVVYSFALHLASVLIGRNNPRYGDVLAGLYNFIRNK